MSISLYLIQCFQVTVQLTYKVKWARELHASPSRVARKKLASAVVCAFLLALIVSHLAVIISYRA